MGFANNMFDFAMKSIENVFKIAKKRVFSKKMQFNEPVLTFQYN